MPRRSPGLLLLLALAVPTGALAARNGDYSNLCRSPQSGDLVGMTLTLSGDAAKPSVDLRVCEGVCWNARIAEVRLQDNRLSFTAEERVLNDHNEISKQMIYRFTAQLAQDGAGLTANMVYGPQALRWLGAPTDTAAPLCR
jgi:hypothetical protein